MQKHGLFLFLLLIGIFLISACANQVTPTGGTKDTAPPKVVKSKPENLTVNFKSKTILITFDEFYNLKDPSSQVFISPALKNQLKLHIKNKSLLIELNDSLNANTTYTIYFGNAIRDVNEGNELKNFQYVFSTGNYIDSMRISGFVKTVLDAKPVSNAVVMLYKSFNDSVVLKNNPDYFIKTDPIGFFQLNHLKQGTYKLFALRDLNANNKYEYDELLAFSDTDILVKDTNSVYQLNMFKAVPQKNKLISATSLSQGKIKLIFAARADSFFVNLLSPVSEVRKFTFNTTRDTVMCFINPLLQDSVVIITGDRSFMDTISVRLKFNKVIKDTSIRKTKIVFNNNLITINEEKLLSFGSSLELKPNFPVKFLESSAVKIFDSSDSTSAIKNTVELSNNKFSNEQTIEIRAAFKADHFYTIRVPAGLIKDFDGDGNDSSIIKFKYSNESVVGNLKIKFTGLDSTRQYIAFVLNNKREIIFNSFLKNNQTQIKYSGLVPGKYFLQLIEDKNENGYWDSGNYWSHLQPERIFNYLQEINIRANWDLDITMSISNEIKRKK